MNIKAIKLSHKSMKISNIGQTIKAQSFKIHCIIPYLSIFALCVLLCTALEHKAKEKLEKAAISLSKTIAEDFLQMEKQIEVSINNAAIALQDYLATNPKPSRDEMIHLSRELGVSSLSVYSGKTGRLEYSSAIGLYDPKKRDFYESYSILNSPWIAEMKSANIPLRYGFLTINRETDNKPRKVVTRYSKKLNNFVTARYSGSDLERMLEGSISAAEGILSISIFAPSGTTILKAGDHECRAMDLKMTKYRSNPKIKYFGNNAYIIFSFGGIKKSQSAQRYGITKDANTDKYFYNIAVNFDAMELIKQIWFLRITFTSICLFLFVAIYYINAYVEKSNQLLELSEKTSDKVTHLCNARLGEVRRYVTKIVKDSMRVNSMNKVLPEEMVQLLDRAFREVHDRDLTNVELEEKSEK